MSLLKSNNKLVAHADYSAEYPMKRLCYGKDMWISSSFVVDIIVAHYNLRAAVQRGEHLEKNNLTRSQTSITCPDPKIEGEVKLNARRISMLERYLYECESRAPR